MPFDIGQGLFDAWFDFSRPTVAPYRDADGELVDAAIDAPRFDHDDAGLPVGLLVEPGEQLGQADRARLQLDAIGATVATVLHARLDESGVTVRRAWYTRDPQATIDACLGQAGTHLSIAAVPGYRPNAGGFVRFRGVDWQLSELLGVGAGNALGDDGGRALIGGAELVDEVIPVGLPPKEAVEWFRAKGFIFGFSWQDVWHEEHGRAFTVAKAMTRDVLETIREAVDRAIAEGETLEQFKKDLRPKLESLGWWGKKDMVDPATGEVEAVRLGSPRRLRTIFQTNMRTSYAAGRWERIQRNKRAFPFLEYVSVMDGRERPQHHAWHGTVLPVDDPWWDTHYPPNGWGCRCLPKPVSRGQAARRGLKETKPKVFPDREFVNRRTGEIMSIEQGIDPGWAYHVGKARRDGLTPRPMNGDGIAAMSSLTTSVEIAVNRFFHAFGVKSWAAELAGRTYVDLGNWPIAIAASWFRDNGGEYAWPAGIEVNDLADVALAIQSPTEIRWLWIAAKDGPAQLVRRYFGPADAAGRVMVVDIARWWRARRVPADRSAAMRKGKLAWSATDSR